MDQLTIVFLGICFFTNTAGAPRTAVVLDLSKGTVVHKHKIQPHSAYIAILETLVDKGATDWPYIPEKGGYITFALDDRDTLTIDGLQAEPPLTLATSFTCEVPRLPAECPDFGTIKPWSSIKARAAATLDLHYGKLEAFADPNGGAIFTQYTQTVTKPATITGERRGTKRKITLSEKRAQVLIVNQPAKTEITGNHFLAYYELAAGDICCTNLPFPKVGTACPQPTPPEWLDHLPEHMRMSTVGCSNSTYP